MSEQVRSERQVVVVGGGAAGLTAAVWAARGGARVELLEAISDLGGRARTREERGFRFNMGPHALYLGAEAMAILRALGIELRGTRPSLSGVRGRFRGRFHALPAGGVSLMTTGLLGAREKLELGRWLAQLPQLDTSAWDAIPVDRALAKMFSGERSRALLRALIRLTSYTHAPEQMSAGAALEQFRRSLDGVFYLADGWGQLIDALAGVARAQGVRVRSGVRVRKLETIAGRHVVTLDDGSTVAADAVVLAMGPGEASAIVDGGADPVLREWAERSLPVRAASLDLGLSSLPFPKRTFCLGIDEPTYYSVHSVAAGLAPEGAAQIQIARYLRPDEKPEREELMATFESLLDGFQPGWRQRVVCKKLSRDLRVTHAVVTAEGGGLAGRPPERVVHRRGLYLAGDWVGERGQLVDAAIASGERAGREAGLGG